MPLSFLPKSHPKRWRRRLATVFVLLIIGGGASAWEYERYWEGKMFPGVSLGLLDVGGKTPEEARALIQGYLDDALRTGLPYLYQSARANIQPIITSPDDPDLSYELIEWHPEAMIDQAVLLGREGAWWQRWREQVTLGLVRKHLPAEFTLRTDRLTTVLQENFRAFERPATDARLTISENNVVIIPETIGRVFDYPRAIAATEDMLHALTVEPIALTLVTDYPELTENDLRSIQERIQTIVARGPLRFTFDDQWWRVHPEEFIQWFGIERVNGTVTMTTREDVAKTFLSTIAEEIAHPARDAKFVLTDHRVTEFQSAREGRSLNLEKTLEQFQAIVLAGTATDAPLVVDTLAPTVQNDDVNTLGIVELIGVGRSNFKGSPQNRRHNIAVGARALHGILIAPGEEFSLLKALGDIDAAAGYKTELVIKGNRTIPEYGGGLCQIGTTTFRATLGSGLPITERQNHSYSVSYYLENGKPGTDATIYGPHPDFRFINDTGAHILIQTRIEKDDLTFEFWGKKDGRIASRTEPKVWNIRKPPPPKIIQTEDLPPGVKKCTERAHNGMTAEFTYTVTMPNNEKREQVFRSNYRPWQEVCLVGKTEEEKMKETEGEETP